MFKMAKKSKVKTPDWILEGYDSPEEYAKSKGVKTKKKEGKTFKVRKCPKCGSYDVAVVIGEVGVWECKKCGWKGQDVEEEELTEEEFMKYLDEKGEEVA
jgi:ribosomal protein L37AE/L43A